MMWKWGIQILDYQSEMNGAHNLNLATVSRLSCVLNLMCQSRKAQLIVYDHSRPPSVPRSQLYDPFFNLCCSVYDEIVETQIFFFLKLALTIHSTQHLKLVIYISRRSHSTNTWIFVGPINRNLRMFQLNSFKHNSFFPAKTYFGR